MRGHLQPVEMEMLRRGRLRGQARTEAIRHLGECHECRSKAVIDGAGVKLERAFGTAVEHASYEDLEGLVEGTADGETRTMLETHFRGCETCAAEYRDLLEFRSTLRRNSPARKAAWLAAAAFAAAATLLIIAGRVKPRANVPTPESEPLTVSLNDGGQQIGIDATGTLRGFAAGTDNQRQILQQVLRSGQLPRLPAGIAALKRERDVLLGPPSGPMAWAGSLTPVGTVAPETRPVFRWLAGAGASRFVVSIYTTDFEPVMQSSELPSATWKPQQALQPGQTYIWSVSAIVNGQRLTSPRAPEPEARFRVATDEENRQFAQASTLQPHSDLLIAAVAARLGMLDEARAALRRLKAANPRSPLPDSLLAALK